MIFISEPLVGRLRKYFGILQPASHKFSMILLEDEIEFETIVQEYVHKILHLTVHVSDYDGIVNCLSNLLAFCCSDGTLQAETAAKDL